MKKFLALFLVLTLLFSFAACNKDDATNSDETTSGQGTEQTTDKKDTTNKKPGNNEEKTTAEPFKNPNLTEPSALFKLVDVKDYEFKSGNPNTTASSGVTFIAKRYESKNAVANNIPAKISTGGAEIILNETIVNDFVSQGWTVVSKNDVNTAVEAGKDTSVILKNSKGEVTKIIARNKTSNSVAIADCVITEVGIVKDIKQQTWADFTIDGKANTSSSTYADYVNAFGKPKNINVAEYYQGNDYTRCKATLVFEKVVGNETWTISVTFEDTNGKATIDSCIIEVN